MAVKIPKAYFDAKEVLLVGYSQKNESYCESIRQALQDAGKTVYPINPKGTWGGVTVYKSLDAAPAQPWFAVVLTNKDNTKLAMDQLVQKGIKRILFASSLCVDKTTLDLCIANKIQTAIACPLMAFGKGFHRFHGWLAGVEKWI